MYFGAADLFQLVKPSGLFPDDEVDKRILKVLEESEKKDFLEELNFANFDWILIYIVIKSLLPCARI